MVFRQGINLMMFVCGATLAGLAAIHFVWLNPAVIGPFALMIGMTPFVLLFEYSLEVPGYLFPLGTIIAGASWLLLRRSRPRPMAVKAVILRKDTPSSRTHGPAITVPSHGDHDHPP